MQNCISCRFRNQRITFKLISSREIAPLAPESLVMKISWPDRSFRSGYVETSFGRVNSMLYFFHSGPNANFCSRAMCFPVCLPEEGQIEIPA